MSDLTSKVPRQRERNYTEGKQWNEYIFVLYFFKSPPQYSDAQGGDPPQNHVALDTAFIVRSIGVQQQSQQTGN